MEVKHEDHMHCAYLMDDGTLDTVIEVDGRECRFDSDSLPAYARASDGAMTPRGLRALTIEACEAGMLEASDDEM